MSKVTLVFALFCLVGVFGKNVPESRMVGGQDAAQGQFPFVVSVRYSGEHTCVGAIVGSNWVVTSARCTANRQYDNMAVIVGGHLLSSGGYEYPVINVYQHPYFNQNTLDNDIVLLEIVEDFYLTELVQIAPMGYTYLEEDVVTVAIGWAAGGDDNVQWIKQLTIANNDCRQIVPEFLREMVHDSNMCVMSETQEESACTGSVGAPILVGTSVVGVMSWVQTCVGGTPDVYTRLSEHKEWIESIMN